MSYTVAMCGVFHTEKYVNMIRFHVFQQAMLQQGEDVEIVLFSPCGEAVQLADSRTVYPITMLEELQKDKSFDAVVIDGDLYFGTERLIDGNGNVADCVIHDAWIKPIVFAVTHGVKVMFNAPRVPFAVSEMVAETAVTAFRAVDYLSVQDSASSAHIASVFAGSENVPPVGLASEPLCGIVDFTPTGVSETSPFDSPYAVIQFDSQRPTTEDEQLANAVQALYASGLQVVLVPFEAKDQNAVAMAAFNERCGGICRIYEEVPSCTKIATLLKHGEYFIGNDVYGVLTAMLYGHVGILYNYGSAAVVQKQADILNEFYAAEYAASTAEGVNAVLNQCLAGTMPFHPKTNSAKTRCAHHYEVMLGVLRTPMDTSNKSGFMDPLMNLLSVVTSNQQQIGELKNSLNMVKGASKEEADALRGQVEALRADCAAKEAACATAQNDFNAIQGSFFWRLTSPARRVMQALKNFVASRRSLMKLMVFAKGFLRGGPRGAKRQLSAYNAIHQTRGKMTLTIPKSVRNHQEAATFSKDITFSILVPLYNTPTDFLEQMIQSVELQTYSKWELCLADGSDDAHAYVGEYCLEKMKNDPRIKYQKLTENKGISENTNACIEMATGNYIALFDHDDVLDPTVLYEYMVRICEDDADFLYCDEDKFNEFGGELYDANFKPDFAIDNLRSNNYICHFTVFKASLLEKSGTFRKEFDGSQDHDLVLRLTEHAQSIVHIPKVLYHWRVSSASVASDPYAKPYTIKAGRQAVTEHLERVGLKATVDSTKIHPNIYRIKYDIIGNPLVSIIIPNYNHVDELSRCIDSIMEKSTYRNFEIIIVENNSDSDTFAYYDTLKAYDNIKVVVYKPTAGFNYSAINNFGVQFASGEHYILLNNDVEIITPEWIEEMLMYSQREDVGAVGAMLYYPNDTIQHAGVTLGVLTLAGHNFKHSPRGNPGYFGRAGYQQNVTAVTAACLMLPASVYKEVNGLDESFAVAFNDIDFCMRIRAAGHLIVFTPFAELYHYESVSRGDDISPEKRARFVSEVTRFQTRWKKELEAGDPYYNPNLTLDREDFSYKN